ncbi:MAG: SDR family NAD(P)-dependent oxidoreductase [Acidimicrobiia bacterium]|nr:SDR family NAD(P)-dependent oxidoreductase [Acidimicrobiia bacterium]
MLRKVMHSGVSGWKPDRLDDLTGKRYMITGANSGLGLEAAKILAAKNADIVMACRTPAKATAAQTEVESVAGGGVVSVVRLDLADTSSIRECADEVRETFDGLDALVNNAGVMQTPQGKTADGFETQFGTNHLGHFLLNGLLYDQVAVRAGRIVVVASIAHMRATGIDWDDPMLDRSYSPTKAYGQSKLSNLIYGLELSRRLAAVDSPVAAITVHPGYANTNLQFSGPTGIWQKLYKVGNLAAQSAEAGAYPEVLGAAGREARNGAYYGPTWFLGARGPVGDARATSKATDTESGRRLWALSEELLGVTWDLPGNAVSNTTDT